ncbi:MAG: flippase-like domain-containing protein [Gemmatimonadota bacterium]|nr:flippase-like domain-containing protein [Gemmatimonadota bacterium]
MKFDWKSVLGLVITVALLWWIFRQEDPVEIWHHIRGADFGLLFLAVAITTAGFAVRALRWRYFLEPIQPDSRFRPRFEAVCIGFMSNNLLPARVGEFTRAYAYGRLEGVPVTAVLATLVVERVLDGLAIMGLLVVAVLAPSFPAETLPPAVLGGIRWVTASIGGLLLVVLALILMPEITLRMVAGVARRFLPKTWADRTEAVAHAFLQGLSSLKNPRLLTLGLLWSVGFWIFHSVSFWVGLRAFDIHLPFAAALFLNGTIAMAVSVPAAPGFFGTFHLGVKLALVDVYGVLTGPALGFAFGWHLGAFIPVTLMGLWYARKLGLSLGQMASEGRRGAPGDRGEMAPQNS